MQRRGFLSRLSALLAVPFLPATQEKPKARLPESEAAIWTTRDGRQISVADMKDDHLRRAIFYLSRQHVRAQEMENRLRMLDVLVFESFPPPSVPATPWEWNPIYMVMLKEANHRSLRWV